MWQMSRIDGELICEGGYAEKAYAVVESNLMKMGLID
jgi:hypothetical protein